jgi:hypothetical protein
MMKQVFCIKTSITKYPDQPLDDNYAQMPSSFVLLFISWLKDNTRLPLLEGGQDLLSLVSMFKPEFWSQAFLQNIEYCYQITSH